MNPGEARKRKRSNSDPFIPNVKKANLGRNPNPVPANPFHSIRKCSTCGIQSAVAAIAWSLLDDVKAADTDSDAWLRSLPECAHGTPYVSIKSACTLPVKAKKHLYTTSFLLPCMLCGRESTLPPCCDVNTRALGCCGAIVCKQCVDVDGRTRHYFYLD